MKKQVTALTKRNMKLFYKDKGTFFTSLATPMILMVLYATFLYKIYEDSFRAGVPEGVLFPGDTLKGLVGGLLLSSLLSVSAVTVSFCANLCMVADKYTGAKGDISIAPVKPRTMAFSYYFSTVMNGLIISMVATAIGCVYLCFVGWYLSLGDILLFLLDVFVLVLFGTALSSVVAYPLTTQGQLSAAGSIISSGYGFICGAYMPISSFSEGLRNVLSFFPGTYGTSLLRNHALRGVFAELEAQQFPADAIEGIKVVADCNIQFLGNNLEIWQMYLGLIVATALLVGGYVLLNVLSEKRKTK